MSWNPYMEAHYMNTSYPYNSAGSFMEYFEGLTYEHVNFIFDGASQIQKSVYPSMNANLYKFSLSQSGSSLYYDHSHAYEIHALGPQIDDYRRPLENSSTMTNVPTAAVSAEREGNENMGAQNDPEEWLEAEQHPASMGSDTASQSQKKRTLEALERRFAVAKAELIQQQKKTQNENNNTTSSISSIAPPVHLPPAPSTPSCLNSSLKKDLQENGPAYSQLSHPVYENLLTTNKFQSKRGSMVDMILHELLQHGDSAQKYLQGSRSKKIDNWILLDNYVQGRGKSTSSHIRALKAHSKRSKKHMSMKQHKKCGSFVLPQDRQKFTVFKPMHEMWKGYVMQLLKNTGTNQLAQCLLSADLHGAVILVAQCKVASFTGITGIMIRETAETFGILAEDDKFWVVPKKCSVFIFQVDCWKITLQGDKLTSRNLGL